MKKYYLIATLVILAGFYSYHFLAAEKAEEQIHETIQKQLKQQADSLNIQYSEIDISPFSANVTFKDLSIISKNYINRSQELTFDLEYLDFLNIYFRGPKKGLERLNKAIITAASVSYTDRSNLNEVKSDSLTINYYGNVFKTIQSVVTDTSFLTKQSIDIKGLNIRISLPNSPVNRITAKSLSYKSTLEKGEKFFLREGIHEARLDSLQWAPSKSFQDTYGFFLKGFGYPTDAVPFEYAELDVQPTTSTDTLSITASLNSELALLEAKGKLYLEIPFQDSEFQSASLSLSNFSGNFSTFLQNVEQLFPGSISESDNKVVFKLQGSIGNPRVLK